MVLYRGGYTIGFYEKVFMFNIGLKITVIFSVTDSKMRLFAA